MEGINKTSQDWHKYFSEIKGCMAQRTEIQEKLEEYTKNFEKAVEKKNTSSQKQQKQSDQDIQEFKKVKIFIIVRLN